MSVSWSPVVGIGLDMTGLVCIGSFFQKSPGMLTPAAIKQRPHVGWLEPGIFLSALGLATHVLGNVLG